MSYATYDVRINWTGDANTRAAIQSTLDEYVLASMRRVTGASLASRSRTGTAQDWGRWSVPEPSVSSYNHEAQGYWDFGDTPYAVLNYTSMLPVLVSALRAELGRASSAEAPWLADPSMWGISTRLVGQPSTTQIEQATAAGGAPSGGNSGPASDGGSVPIFTDYENVPGTNGSGSTPSRTRSSSSTPSYPTGSGADAFTPPASSPNGTRNMLIAIGAVAIGGGLVWYFTTQKPAKKRGR